MIRQAIPSDQEIVARLLEAGAGRAPSTSDVQAVDYDWKTPHRFAGAGSPRLRDLAGKLVEKVSTKMSALFGEDVRMEIAAVGEHYAAGLGATDAGKGAGYAVTLLAETGDQRGQIVLPPRTALGWIGRMLGGAAAAGDPQRELSALETDLLLDALNALTDALSATLTEAGGKSLTRAAKIDKAGRPPGEESTEYVEVQVRRTGDKDDAGFSYLLFGEVLTGAILGTGGPSKQSPADLRNCIMGHLEAIPVQLTANVGHAEVRMREIVAMEPGDIVILSRKTDEPAELTVGGKPAFEGMIAKCEGDYALFITSCKNGSNG
jgi:flagellar motor switch protein FliM